MGAVYRAANLSRGFRVRHVGYHDILPFGVSTRLMDVPASLASAASEAAAAADASKAAAAKKAAAAAKKKKKKTSKVRKDGDDDVDEEEDEDEDDEDDDEAKEAAAKAAKAAAAAAARAATAAADAKAAAAAAASATPWSKRTQLFLPQSQKEKTKTIQFARATDFIFTIMYDTYAEGEKGALPVGTDTNLGVFHVTGVAEAVALKKYADLAAPKMEIKYEISKSGLAEHTKVSAVFEEIILPPPEVEVVANETEGNSTAADEEAGGEGAAAAEKGAEKAAKDADADTDADRPDADADSDTDADADADADADSEEKKEKKEKKEKAKKKKKAKKAKKRVYRVPLTVRRVVFDDALRSALAAEAAAGDDSSVGAKAATSVLAAIPAYDALTSAQYAASQSVLAALDRQDALKAERDGAKNELEAYVFSTRSYLREFEEDVSKVRSSFLLFASILLFARVFFSLLILFFCRLLSLPRHKVAIEGQPDELMENLTLAEDWLYEPEGAYCAARGRGRLSIATSSRLAAYATPPSLSLSLSLSLFLRLALPLTPPPPTPSPRPLSPLSFSQNNEQTNNRRNSGDQCVQGEARCADEAGEHLEAPLARDDDAPESHRGLPRRPRRRPRARRDVERDAPADLEGGDGGRHRQGVGAQGVDARRDRGAGVARGERGSRADAHRHREETELAEGARGALDHQAEACPGGGGRRGGGGECRRRRRRGDGGRGRRRRRRGRGRGRRGGGQRERRCGCG